MINNVIENAKRLSEFPSHNCALETQIEYIEIMKNMMRGSGREHILDRIKDSLIELQAIKKKQFQNEENK